MLDYFYEQIFDARSEPERTYVADGTAAVEGRFIGVHKGEFAGVPATGQEVDVPLAVFYTVEERRIVEVRVWFMVSSFLQQVSD
jgi:predicted ester cyclase